MLSGRDALTRINQTLRSARGELERLDRDLQATSRAVTENKLAQARAIDRMARIRLDAARRGEVVAHLESAMRAAGDILESRENAIASLNDRIRDAGVAVETLEERRERLHDEVDEAAGTLAEREAAVQKSLANDAAFQAQLERTREADAIAVSALEKARLAGEDRRRKGEPFERDELFMYLWERGYGTSAYSANPLARMLDAWVARLCNYAEARPNYWMLLEIPKRLAEHAEHARELADGELDALQDVEEAAARRGGVPEASAALEVLEKQQDDLDAEIATAESTLGNLHAERHRFTSGTDDYLRNALREISAAMEQRDVRDLTRFARATMTPEDDEIVDELRHLRQAYDDLENELGEIRALQRKRLQPIRELENVRRDFKRNRYDDVHSRFGKGSMIERMIGDVIAGVINGSALWNVLRRHQRYADTAGEWPDFGSGGILRPGRRPHLRHRQRPPTWHWPGPGTRRGGGGFKLPRRRISSRGRGGFRTGGGF